MSHFSNIPDDFFFVLASGSPRRREFLQVLGVPFIVVPPLFPPRATGKGEAKSKTRPEPGRRIQNRSTERASSEHPRPELGSKAQPNSSRRSLKSKINETPLPGETPPELVQRLSRVKAQAVVVTLASLEPPYYPLSSQEPVPPVSGGADSRAIVIAADTVVVLEGRILGKPDSPDEAVQMLKQLRLSSHTVYSGLTVAVPPKAASILAPPQIQGQDEGIYITRLHQSTVWMRRYTDAEIDAYVAGGDPLDKAGAYGIQNKSFAPVARLEGCFASVMGLPLGELAAALKEIGIALPPIAPLCRQHTGHPCCQK